MNPQLACPQRQWLHSSVGRAPHRYREVTGSNPVEVLNFFFSGFFTQLQKLRSLRRSFLQFHEIGLMKCSYQYYKEVQPLVLSNQTWMALKSFPWNLLITVKPEDTSLSSNHATGVRKSRGFASPLAPEKSWRSGSKSRSRQAPFGICKSEILQQYNNAIVLS